MRYSIISNARSDRFSKFQTEQRRSKLHLWKARLLIRRVILGFSHNILILVLLRFSSLKNLSEISPASAAAGPYTSQVCCKLELNGSLRRCDDTFEDVRSSELLNSIFEMRARVCWFMSELISLRLRFPWRVCSPRVALERLESSR